MLNMGEREGGLFIASTHYSTQSYTKAFVGRRFHVNGVIVTRAGELVISFSFVAVRLDFQGAGVLMLISFPIIRSAWPMVMAIESSHL